MDRTERNDLVVANLPLVGYLVSDLCARATHLSRDDLASAGALALVTSADSFDPTLGIPFGAYARRRIIGSFADEMRSADWATRTERKRIKEALAVQETLSAALGRTAEIGEIAAVLGVDNTTAASAIADASFSVAALDDSIAERIGSPVATPEESAIDAERLRYLAAAVEALPERMRMIVRGVYFEDRPVKEIAEELGITHSAVSQQRSEAIRLMRDGLVETYGWEGETGEGSRVGAARRSSYLARVAEYAVMGIRSAAPGHGSLSTAS